MTATEAREISSRKQDMIPAIMVRIKNAALDKENEIKVSDITTEAINQLIVLGYSVHPRGEKDNQTTISW